MTAMSPIYVLNVKDILSTNLRPKHTIDKILEKGLFNLPYDEIIVDFSGVNSISPEFATQYLLCKSKTRKEVHEVNVPLNLREALYNAETS